MMEFRYKPTDYEKKLMVLYAIEHLKVNATYPILDYVLNKSAAVNYFELEQHVGALIETNNIEELEFDGKHVFSITPTGEETVGFFEKSIPFSVREKLQAAVEEVNGKESGANAATADFIPINEKEYQVTCHIRENNTDLLKLELYVGSRERAERAAAYLRKDMAGFYQGLMHLLEQQKEE